jgi:hypothetical protein
VIATGPDGEAPGAMQGRETEVDSRVLARLLREHIGQLLPG